MNRHPTSRAAARCLVPGLLGILGGCQAGATGLATSLPAVSRSFAPAEVAIAYRDLGSGTTCTVHGDRVMHAASTMKVPVMIELFRQADAGEGRLDTPIPVRNRFRSIVDGSPYSLTPADDSDRELYERVGQQLPVRELLRRMIVRSSNLATNILIERAGAARIQRTIEALGTRRMRVLRGVEDGKAYRQGLSNTATARDLMELLTAIAEQRAASPAACAEMVGILSAQEFNDLIPAGLPKGTRVAHKTGWITGIRHDAAIVYPPDRSPYVLVVLTRGFTDPRAAAAAIAAVAARVHADR